MIMILYNEVGLEIAREVVTDGIISNVVAGWTINPGDKICFINENE